MESLVQKNVALNGYHTESDVYDDGFLHVEHQRFYVTVNGQAFYGFTRKEFYLLSRLARDFGRPSLPNTSPLPQGCSKPLRLISARDWKCA